MDKEKKERLEKAGFKIGSVDDFLNEALSLSAEDLDTVIVRHGKPIGICECKGKGKDKCRGNGWIRDGAGFQKCPYFQDLN